jgi:ubiquitin carboxyl-terminal hydrolase 1
VPITMAAGSAKSASFFDAINPFELKYAYYRQERVFDRLWQPSVLLPILLLFATLAYQSYRRYHLVEIIDRKSVSDHALEAVAYCIPSSLLFAVDDWLKPPVFPRPMLQAQARTHATKGEALARILRMDRAAGVMGTVWNTGRPRLLSLSQTAMGMTGDADEPAGLGNWDNSCYQNSILQALASLRTLPQYLCGPEKTDPELSAPEMQTSSSLRRLIEELNDPLNNGRTMWTPAVLKNMSTWQQQDAQEYFSKLLEEVDKDLTKVLIAKRRSPGFASSSEGSEAGDSNSNGSDSGYHSLTDTSRIEVRADGNPVEGLVAQRVACVTCGHTDGLSMIPFNCLTLNLGLDRYQYDIHERLDHFTHLESIQGVECPKCTLLKFQRLIKTIIARGRAAGHKEEHLRMPQERLEAISAALEEDRLDDKTLSEVCKVPSTHRVNSTKTKQTIIARPPRSLAIHLNRSVFDEMTGQMFKNSSSVRFPEKLDLGPWCLGSAKQRPTSSSQEPDRAKQEDGRGEEQWLLDATSSMVAGDTAPSVITGPLYELRAVITHQGRHENGHYVCYRRHRVRPPPTLEGKGLVDPQLQAESEPEDIMDLGTDSCMRDDPQGETEQPDKETFQWWRLSDHQVSLSSEEAVLAQGGVFMLFYDCIDSQSRPISERERLDESGLPDCGRIATEAEEGSAGSSASGSEDDQVKEARASGGASVLAQAINVPLPAVADDYI